MGCINSRSNFGITMAGEFSPAFLDCGLFVNGVNSTRKSYQGDCSFWDNYKRWSLILKSSLSELVLAQMDALGDYFFFTWKVGDPPTLLAEVFLTHCSSCLMELDWGGS